MYRGERGRTYAINEFNNHTNESIHPTVVSPRKERQLNTRSRLKLRPATRAVKRMRAVATAYQMSWRTMICVRIFRGGSSVRAPGRGGRRRRAMMCVYFV